MTTPVSEAVRVLQAAFPDVPVSTRVPNPRPRRFIRLSRAGGSRGYGVDHPRLIIECWSTDEGIAERDVLAVDDFLRNEAGDLSRVISAWTDVTIAYFPDPDIPAEHRYQVTGLLHCITS